MKSKAVMKIRSNNSNTWRLCLRGIKE